MRKGVIVVILISILVLGLYSPANPSLSDDALAIVHESPFETFTAADDGAESDQSITSFSSTLADDVMRYPDTGPWSTIDDNADSYTDYGMATTSGSITDTYTDDANYHQRTKSESVLFGMDYTFDAGGIRNVETPIVSVDTWFYTTSGFDVTYKYYIYDYVTETYDQFWTYTGQANVACDRNDTLTGEYIDNSTNEVSIRFTHSAFTATTSTIRAHYLALWYTDTYAGYAESFEEVDDWAIQIGNTITTDGDLIGFHVNGDGSWDYYYTNSPSITNVLGYYVEYRFSANVSLGMPMRIYGFTEDTHGGSSFALDGGGNLFPTTTAQTKRFYINYDGALESIRIHLKATPSPIAFKFDYFRVSPANETGYGHDCSTTTGTDAGSSDGDLINVTSSITIDTDTTTTVSLIETSYYQFLDMFVDDGSGNILIEGSADGSSWSSIVSDTAINASTHYRGNILAAGIDIKQLRVNVTGWATLDFVKIASIANFTVSQYGSPTVTDYFYVEDSVVKASITTTGWDRTWEGLRLDYDPALTVDTTTYTVWNMTSSDFDNALWNHKIGGWQGYSSAGETRGGFASGTLTDFEVLFWTTSELSAIKFISDGTAPTVVRSSSTPNDPQDDETVTISAVVEDTILVYEVDFNAIVYPAGFSDVDYSATEQTDNLWTYTFTTIDAGYYCFKVIASDGANLNALTEYAYIELTVREAAIIIQEITLIGAGQDFTMMTFSARINRDCSYTIYEESASSPEADTYTGSVSAPSFNLAWEKLDVVDTNVNFTITFVSGSLTENYTSQYQVAQTTFYVEPGWAHDGHEFSETVTVTGRITKLATYTVYIDDVNATTGTISSLDFDIAFSKILTNAARQAWHDFAIKFVNGSQTCWANGTFYLWKHNPDKPPGGGVVVFDQDFWLKIMIAMSVIVGIGIVIQRATGMGNLPNYPKKE